ncbi:Mu transposase C-terminal domain-containing protein (plasmid) [Embleya sp. NBC_00888]|nr:Mu transposase C-terminal domain-containing protein [Embleya sp. NBC_00888]WSY43326.1 Mu transposase C-terminal domain-containing protein [Embleya sp. NBC_00888]WSY43722.1 Mu transposase C-terminal domain-containing protein [Embleya sp. NBC_00888]WSY48126.1 Mu transposase C-terminal domain-containing protein [Embleya sp. NBC_00888]
MTDGGGEDYRGGVQAVFPSRLGRAAAMPRLLDLDGRGELTAVHVRLVAQALGKSERTVWRWLAVARRDRRLARVEASRFTVTTEIRQLLALWGGNASRVHAELVRQAAEDPDAPAVPSLSTLHRAVRRDLTRGERAGLKSGEAARRAHDVFGQRPPTHRNAAWEGDHKHVPVEVDVEGELATPWVTWFIDCATKVVTGVAVTAHAPSRDAVLASLRIAITRGGPFGPMGGLPGRIRVDRGKEFLCATVTAAMGAFAVPVTDLPAYSPHLKGTIEALNDAVEEMFLVSLPRYTGRQRLTGGRLADPDAPPLTYEAFVGLLLDWVTWWNTEHRPAALNGKTPVQAWQADPTPLADVPAGQMATFALEDDGRTYTITTNGVRRRRRDYLAPWMNGRTGTKVSVRHLPHHDDTIEVFDVVTGRYLGPAFLAAAASREQIRSVQAARTAAARRLKADLKAAEKLRRRRFEASTVAAPPRLLASPTSSQAEDELGTAARVDRRALARPDFVPHGPAPAGWVRPVAAAPPPDKDTDDH